MTVSGGILPRVEGSLLATCLSRSNMAGAILTFSPREKVAGTAE